MSAGFREVAVFFGGGLGASARYWLSVLIADRVGAGFPWSTFCINVTGSFLIGLLITFVNSPGAGTGWRLFVVVGVLGGYTTFSSFSLETVNLLRERHFGFALGNVLGSCLLGLGACWLGLWVATAFVRA